MNPQDRHRIDSVEQDVYSRKQSAKQYVDERSPITAGEFDVNADWNKEGGNLEELLLRERMQKEVNQGTLFKKILIGSIIFFLLAVGAAAFVFLRGSNFVSGNNIDIEVVGPSAIDGGEELSYDLVIKNNNGAALESSTVTVQYPEGSRVVGNMATELSIVKEDVGALSSRAETRKTYKAVLFGEKDAIKQIKITYEYRLKDSGATFYKDKNYDIAIKSTPIDVTIEYPSEVNSNDEVNFVVTIASNSGETLSNLLLKVEYPFGFTFQSADVKAADNAGTLWRVGDLASTQKQIIRIKGILQGQDEEERTFRFSTGIANPEKDDELGAVFSVLPETIRIKRPFINVATNIGGKSSGDAVAALGEKLQGNISFTNNLQGQLLNTKVLVTFKGTVLDKTSISTGNAGFYRSLDNTIAWDKNSDSVFSNLEPGEKRLVTFAFAPLSAVPAGVSQTIDLEITVSGEQINDNGKAQNISTTMNRTVKIASRAAVGARVARSFGAFENSGPIPPRADMATTYNVQWTATNSLNTLTKAVVTTVLPPYVSWVGLADPSNESVTYDSNTRQVSWNIGDLKSGTGFAVAARNAQFQVSMTPSATQVGTAPTLIENSNFIGFDEFTKQNISAVASALTTRFATDPTFRNGDETVAK